MPASNWTWDPMKMGSVSPIVDQPLQFPYNAQQTGAWWNQPLTYAAGVGQAANPAGGTVGGTTGPAGTASTVVPPASGFNLNPQPHTGQGIYGMVPGALGLPNPAADLQAQIPGLQGLNAKASGVINSYLGGQLPPDVQAAIQDAAAQFGVSSGMPGSGLVRNRTARDLGLTSLDLTNKGLQAYGPFVGAVSGTQTVSPALQAQIAETNAINASAPDPTAAGSHAEALYREYLNSLARSGGGQNVRPPQSGTGGYQSPPRYTGSGYGGGYSPQMNQFSVAPGLSYTPQSIDQSLGYSDYGSYPSFDSFLNTSLGVPDLSSGYGDYIGPYSPEYEFNTFSPFDQNTTWEDYIDYLGG